MIEVHGHTRAREGSWALAADLTPLIDVLFMLIVFMVLTANSTQLAIDAALPTTEEEGTSSVDETNVLSIAVGSKDAAFTVDGAKFALWADARKALKDALAADSGRQVVLIADPEAQVQGMVDVMAFLQAEGVGNARIAVRQK